MIVITGLDPVIHAFSASIEAVASTWMAGSSPAMTTIDGDSILPLPSTIVSISKPDSRGLDPGIRMDRRVKPGDDDLACRR